MGHLTVKDCERWAEYRRQVPATLAPWQGELVFRGHHPEILAGQHPHRDTVTIRFPSREAARCWYQSAAYQALIPLRSLAADLDLILFDAV
ncbi:DUF1330 domain-containing protein [Dechloromonas sp. ZY10]|uniref:DUF1330 domain-containing protein n=1 Tax=Dechloromonas aquae TaxID=2664436 RepID=UPI00352770F6